MATMSVDRFSELEDRVAALERITKPAVSRIDPDQFYTVAEAAALLGCGKTNVYDLLLSGELAKTCIGAGKKGLRVRGSDLLQFLDSRREGGPAPRKSLGGGSSDPAAPVRVDAALLDHGGHRPLGRQENGRGFGADVSRDLDFRADSYRLDGDECQFTHERGRCSAPWLWLSRKPDRNLL
jgi:excisionase family DNA binding protein